MTEPKEDVEIDEALDIYADPLLVDALREAEERGRRAALEEAARVAEKRYADAGFHPFYRSAAWEIVAAIRALKEAGR